jgi:hypothetical protein
MQRAMTTQYLNEARIPHEGQGGVGGGIPRSDFDQVIEVRRVLKNLKEPLS